MSRKCIRLCRGLHKPPSTLPRNVCVGRNLTFKVDMARAVTVQSSGSPLKVLKQFANNFLSGDVIPVRCGLLTNEAKFLFFAKFQNLTMKLVAVVFSLSPFCSYFVSLVSMQISEPC